MSETNVYVTQETFDKMREELQRMKSIDRPAASRAIAEAREKGDLKENAEYDAAKEAQGMLESKINIENVKIKIAPIKYPLLWTIPNLWKKYIKKTKH